MYRGRAFDESTVPTRRLRSDTARSNHLTNGASRLSAISHKPSQDDRGRRSRANTPGKEIGTSLRSKESGTTLPNSSDQDSSGTNTPSRRRRSSKGSQPEEGVDEISTSRDATPNGRLPSIDEKFPKGASEKERIERVVESRPNSPGIDPLKAAPISAVEQATLPRSFTRIPRDPNHKAATVHLPPKDVQEQRQRRGDVTVVNPAEESLKQNKREELSIKFPPSGNRNAEPMSSPGSTIGPHSATTPGIHDASTDTSPENEGPRYNADDSLVEKEAKTPRTPSELRPDKQEIQQKEEHDRRLQAQIEAVRTEILGSSPTAADAQLRLEEEQAAERPETSATKPATNDAEETAQDMMDDDEDDEVVGVPTPEDEGVPEPEIARPSSEKQVDDPMDVDSAPPKDNMKAKADGTIAVPETQEAQAVDASAEERSSSTPRRTPSSAPTPPNTDRMTTRVSSGAMRHKSVSEILGEAPKPSSSDKQDKPGRLSNSRSSTPQTPGSRARSVADRNQKERSKLSTVVFAKQPLNKSSGNSVLVPGGSKTQSPSSSDYFMPLILAQAYTTSKQHQSLDTLLTSAHKTITTSNGYVPYLDSQTQKILRRIHSLQKDNKWSYRQPKRAEEPFRPTTHRDELLKEMKWMRTDFREERKWKMAVARNLAYACAEWVEADDEDRKLLQVKATPPPLANLIDKDIVMADSPNAVNEEAPVPVPELVASAENDSPSNDFDDEIDMSMLDTVAPTAIFSLTDDDVVFSLRNTDATKSILDELPWYGTPLKVPHSDLPTSDIDPDASWRRPALPLSKYVEGKLVLKEDGPPRKRSRYEYEEESDDEDSVVIQSSNVKQEKMEPLSVEVALFDPQNKHIRDRIQAGHQFRPPSENPMPLQNFFECRNSSHWLWAEDDQLKTLVRDYSYNWQLISCMLSSPSLFTSGAERRTPWECFERWIHLEGLPADMSKTHYFRAYNHRLEAAQRTLQNQYQQATQAPQVPGQAVTPVRRRTTTSIRVERKRNQKHLTLVDAMRKLAKKRETTMQKQAHAQSLASMRKENSNQAQQGPKMIHTPQEFSKIKHDREMQIQERLRRMQQQQEAQRQVCNKFSEVKLKTNNYQQALQQARHPQPQQNQQQYPQQMGAPQLPRGVPAGAAQNPQMQGRPNQLAVPGQNVPHAPMQALPNGMPAPPLPNGHPGNPQMQMKGMPLAQMQGMPGMPGMPGQPRLPPGNIHAGLAEAARQIQQAQRQQVMQQNGQQQSPQMQNPTANMRSNMNGSNQQGFAQNNQGMMTGYNGNNGSNVPASPAHGFAMANQGQAGSPRMPPPQHQGLQQGGANNFAKIAEANYRANNPSATIEQVQKHVREVIQTRISQQQSQQPPQQASPHAQNAMMAAAGSAVHGPVNFANGTQDPRQYAQMLRAQQREQAQANQANQPTGQSHAQNKGQVQAQGQGQNQNQGPGPSPAQGPPQGQSHGQGQNHPPQQQVQPQGQHSRSASATSAGNN